MIGRILVILIFESPASMNDRAAPTFHPKSGMVDDRPPHRILGVAVKLVEYGQKFIPFQYLKNFVFPQYFLHLLQC